MSSSLRFVQYKPSYVGTETISDEHLKAREYWINNSNFTFMKDPQRQWKVLEVAPIDIHKYWITILCLGILKEKLIFVNDKVHSYDNYFMYMNLHWN